MANKVDVVLGMEWGDEGKGRIIDNKVKKDKIDSTVRTNGSNNAGHTVYVGEEKFVLHSIPSGILGAPGPHIMGDGELLEPEAFFVEKDELTERGIEVTDRNLKIGRRIKITMPWHKAFDGIKGGKIDTTRQGVGQTYTDHTARISIFAEDLLDEKTLRTKVEAQLEEKNFLLEHMYGKPTFDVDDTVKRYLEYGKRLAPYLVNTRVLIRELLRSGKKVLVEMAQGTFLDLDLGTYGFNTSSNTTISGVTRGLGISHKEIGRVTGVLKAYPTRVGKGPFPTELSSYDMVNEDILELDPVTGKRKPLKPMTEEEIALALSGNGKQRDRLIRRVGGEFGATTGRPRRIGDPDMVVALYSVEVNGIDEIAITKLDVLDGIPFKVADRYLVDGDETIYFDERGEPVYLDHVFGWDKMSQEDRLRAVHDGYDALPDGMQEFAYHVVSRTHVPISMMTIGKERDILVTKDVMERTSQYL